MYNEQLKEQFISEYIKDRRVTTEYIGMVFEFTEDMECDLEKDVSAFSKEEAIDLISLKRYRQLPSVRNMVTLLNQYTLFVHSREGVSSNTVNGFESLSEEDLIRCVNSKRVKQAILTREEINTIEEELLNDVDKAIVECLFRGISGIGSSDLLELNEDQMRDDDCLVLHSGKVIKMDAKLKTLLLDAFDEITLISYSTTARVTEVEGKGRLYKSRYNNKTSMDKYSWLKRRIIIMRNFFGLEILSAKSIELSGMVDAIERGMKESGATSLRDYTRTEHCALMLQNYDLPDKRIDSRLYQRLKLYIDL